MAQDETRATLSHFRGLNLNPKTLIPKTLHLHSPRSPNRTPPARTDTYHNITNVLGRCVPSSAKGLEW